MIPLESLLNISSGFGQNSNFQFLAIFLIVPFPLVFVVASNIMLIPHLRFIAVTLNGLKFNMLMYSTTFKNWLDFGHCLLILLIVATSQLSEIGKRKDHHRVSSGWSGVWHRSNTGLSSTQYEQIPIILGVWPFWLTPFFFRSITFWRTYG